MNAFEKAKAVAITARKIYRADKSNSVSLEVLTMAVQAEAEAMRHMLTHTDVAQVTADEIKFSWEEK